MKTRMVAAIFVALYVCGNSLAAKAHVPDECAAEVMAMTQGVELDVLPTEIQFLEENLMSRLHRLNSTSVRTGSNVMIDAATMRGFLAAVAETLTVGATNMMRLQRVTSALRDIVECADAAHADK